MGGTSLECVTWNVHRARGADGRVDAGRVVDALLQEVCPPGGADILVLQEADAEGAPQTGLLDLQRIAAATGLVTVHREPALRWGPDSHGFHGVVVLLGPSVRLEGGTLLDLPGYFPRGAVVLDLAGPAGPFRLVATHLSLGQALRLAQMRVIGQFLARRAARTTLLVGDLNEWRPWSGLAFAPQVVGRRFAGPAPATFPVGRPVLPLDRILATAPARVLRARVLDGPGIRAATDHRPLAATVTFG